MKLTFAFRTLTFYCDRFLYRNYANELVDEMTLRLMGPPYDYQITMKADYSKGMNYEQPMLITLVKTSTERT